MSPTTKSHIRRMPLEYEKAQARKVRTNRRKDMAFFLFTAIVAALFARYCLQAGQ